METTLALARILGPLLVLVLVAVLLHRTVMEKMIQSYLDHPALLLAGGYAALLFGLIVVELHNVWVMGWPVVVTLLGWSGVAKGVWLLFLPDQARRVIAAYQRHAGLMVWQGALLVGLGVFLSGKGFGLF